MPFASLCSSFLGSTHTQVPRFALNMLLRGLRADEDEVVQHYVSKAIENISAQSSACACAWFLGAASTLPTATPDSGSGNAGTQVLYALLHIYNTSRSEHLRTTVASALSHLMRHGGAPLVNSFVDKVRRS